MNNNKKILVLNGGGIKGIAHIGALYALQELNFLNNLETFAGTSIGGIILSLYLVGYSPAELLHFSKHFDFEKLKNISITNISSFGLDNGSRMDHILKKLIQKKNVSQNITLKELYEKTKKKLILTSVCLNSKELCYLSYETHPDLELYIAMRMTSAIPFLYTPILYNGKFYIDGGIIDNYPIHPFQHDLDKTIGIFINENKDVIELVNDIETYIIHLLKCFMEGMNYHILKKYEKHTIIINVQSINVINYSLTVDLKDELFMAGYNAVKNKLF